MSNEPLTEAESRAFGEMLRDPQVRAAMATADFIAACASGSREVVAAAADAMREAVVAAAQESVLADFRRRGIELTGGA